MKKTLSVLSILIISLGLSACNTMKGFGKDVERGGEKIQGSATNVQQGGTTSGSTSTSSQSK